MSLRQTFVHCARFPAAASRRSLDRVSVPVWLIVLSDQLLVIVLVGRYPHQLTDKSRAHPTAQRHFLSGPCGPRRISGINPGFPGLSRSVGQVAHVLLTRSPLRHTLSLRTECASLDLHALGAPPAFILSQDQTLQRTFHSPSPRAS